MLDDDNNNKLGQLTEKSGRVDYMSAQQLRRYPKGEQRRKQIVDAAIALIAEQGLHAVTTRAVSRRAGLGASAASYFFDSIDDLVVEAFGTCARNMISDLDALTARIRDEQMDRDRAIDAYVELISAGDMAADRVQYEAFLFADKWPALRAAVNDLLAASTGAAAAMLIAAGRPDLVWASQIVVSMSDGFGLHRIAAERGGSFDGIREALVALMDSLPSADLNRGHVGDGAPTRRKG